MLNGTKAHTSHLYRDLYDLVQQRRGVYKGVRGSKSFAFRGLLKCDRCGADITAQEKFKKLKNGEFNRYVYYNCTLRVDPKCPEKYINETNLCVQMLEFIEANHKKLRISDKLQAKVEKHCAITKTLLDHYQIDQKLDVPFIEYARYVLTKGTDSEKSMLANGIEQKFLLKDAKLEF